jgi:hypothetical protein
MSRQSTRRARFAWLAPAIAAALFSHAALADPMHHGPLADQHAPAGVMFDHMHRAGDFMLGFRYGLFASGGGMLHGTRNAGNAEIVANGCTPHHCSSTPRDMHMRMYMLDIMYAPTDWLTLMVMPMWMSHEMGMRPLEGALPPDPGHRGGHAGHDDHGAHSHGTRDFGDTTLGGMVRLGEWGEHDLHAGVFFNAPTGPVDKQTDGVFTHYGMQPGSGTWDFWPSLTYTGRAGRFTWGTQVSGIMRMEGENESGYRLGDIFQATGWGSYRIVSWVSVSVRGLYTEQSEIEGHYNGLHNHSSPPDLQFNYGGRFWDIGFGVNAVVPAGTLKGLRIGAEWLEPIEDDPNGYQLEREGTLWVNASMAF